VVESFWNFYEEACKVENHSPIPIERFPDRSINGVLRKIQDEQPVVFNRLEQMRQAIWPAGPAGTLFDAGQTFIFTSHPTASGWHHSQLTRTWFHPDFEPFMDIERQPTLRGSFVFGTVVYDEPEIDGVLHIIPEDQYNHLIAQHASVNWKDLAVHTRRELFEQVRSNDCFGKGSMSFESYDELMRVQLQRLQRVTVDCDAIPFGHDNIVTGDGGRTGIYRGMNGKAFYLGHKQWLEHSGTNWTFLTTERLVTSVIENLYEKLRKPLVPVHLDNMPDIYPIRIPAFIDTRAGADKPGKPAKVSAIAKDILEANSNAVVVADGVNSDIGAMSFQRMKGRNDLANNDVFIVLTSLAPDLYARFNVIGQWLGIPDIIALHYQGLINQAVGRNTGFRQQDGTKTVVVCSNRLWHQVISKLNQHHPRVLLYEARDRPW